jgi:putative metallopeptidase DUF4344
MGERKVRWIMTPNRSGRLRTALQIAALVAGVLGSIGGAMGEVPAQFKNPKIVLLEHDRGDGGYWSTTLPDPESSDPALRSARPISPDRVATREAMMKRHVLEEYAAFLSPLRLPRTLRVFASDCSGNKWDSPYYDGDNKWMNLCYSFIGDAAQKAAYLEQNQAKMKLWTPVSQEQLIAGLFAATVLHETGHALFDILTVPIFGREEDAADQIAAFIALQFGTATARTIVKGFAYYWAYEAVVDKANPGSVAKSVFSPNTAGLDANTRCLLDAFCAFSDMHGTASQRMYNTLCLAYGGNHAGFQDFVDAHWLPDERLKNCDNEYRQAYRAFGKTIFPFIDQQQMEKVKAVQWFQAEEMKEK